MPGNDESGAVARPPTDADVPDDLRREFWVLVAVFNVALLGSSLGLLAIAFEGRWTVGGAALAVGLLALVAGVRRYRAVRRNL